MARLDATIKQREGRAMRPVIRQLGRLNSVLSEAGVFFSCGLLVLMTASVLLQVISRELRNPIGWTEEVALSSMVWVAFLCGPWAYRQHQFTRIDVVIEALEVRTRSWLEVAVHVFELVIICGAIMYAWRFFQGGRSSLPALTNLVRDLALPFIGSEAAGAMTVRNFIIYAVVPLSFAGLLLVNLEHILRSLLTATTGKDHRVGADDADDLIAGGTS
jgi:TRAP-type C4-dicarboxylate transport system permease small subunit